MKSIYDRCVSKFKSHNPAIIAYRKRRLTSIIIKLLVLEVICIAVAVTAFMQYIKVLLISILIATIIPVLVIKPWKKIGTRYIGKITSIIYEDCDEPIDKNPANTLYSNRHTVTYICCSVESFKRVHCFRLEQKYESVYHVGDVVMKMLGVDYPINFTKHELIVCPKCGSIYPIGNDRCVSSDCKMPAPVLHAIDF